MKKIYIIPAAVVGAAAVLYLEAALVFTGRFPFHTTINGADVSLMTAAAAQKAVEGNADNYTLKLTGRNNLEDSIKGSDISLKAELKSTSSIASLLKGINVFAWPASLFTSTDLTAPAEVSYDEDQLTQKIKSLTFFDSANVTAPTDATYTNDGGTYKIVDDTPGTTLDEDTTVSTIREAIDMQESSVDLDKSGCYESAAVTADNASLNEKVKLLNEISGVQITFAFGSNNEVLDSETIIGWVKDDSANASAAGSSEGSTEASSDDGTAASSAGSDSAESAADAFTEDGTAASSGSDIKIDTDKAAEYVAGLAKKYDTYGKDRTFTTAAGNTITVPGGTYGWLMDQPSTVTALIDAIKAGKSTQLEPVYTQKAFQYGDVDWDPNNYAEVDLDNQHVYIHKNGSVVVSTDCVSGKALAGNNTPDGTYKLAFKQKDATLRGDNYESHVKYWMPFNLGIGFHDASWRSKFGGDIYVTSGSHGCVNLPPSVAGSVYENVEAGEAVIVYGGMNQSEAVAYSGKAAITDEAPDASADTAATAGDSAATADSDAAAAQQKQIEEITAQAQKNYEATGMSAEQAAAQVQADIAAQAAAQQAAAQQAAAAAAASSASSAASSAAASSAAASSAAQSSAATGSGQ